MAKLVYHGREDGQSARIDCGTMTSHGTVLIGPSIVDVGADVGNRQTFLIWAGKPFVLDEADHARGIHHVVRWMKSHPDFQLLSARGAGTCAGSGNYL